MSDDDWLAGRFEGNRARLRAMAYRMLGSLGDADDAVQEAWIHVAGADADAVANLDGWFTTIVARVCLDMLRARRSRREEPSGDEADDWQGGGAAAAGEQAGPEQEAMLADSVGLALLVVLDRLAPAERVAFVLHDMFAVPFDDIASITGRSSDAARQLASRARRRVRGADTPTAGTGRAPVSHRQRSVAAAFLAASRAGDFEGLLAVLDPDVVLRTDAAAAAPRGPSVLIGATAVARGARASAVRSRESFVALVNGIPGIVYAPGGKVAIVLAFAYTEDKISGIEVIAEPATLEALELAVPA
jgi:RNA polymerase sigma factor (sigma-70 family)